MVSLLVIINKLLFCSFFALASRYPVHMFEIFNQGQSFLKLRQGDATVWCF